MKNNKKITHLHSLGDGKSYSLDFILKQGKQKNLKYRIGVDSLDVREGTIYILALVGIYPGKCGATVYFHKEKLSPKIRNIKDRLWKEAEAAIDFALDLKRKYQADIDAVEFDFNDYNTHPEYISSSLSSSAIGLAQMNGFKGLTKPSELYGIAASDAITHSFSRRRFS